MTGRFAFTMASRDFFDSNVLIYAIANSELEKQAWVRGLLTEQERPALGGFGNG